MNEKRFKIVGLGEVLFDILPSQQKMLGGAPANFAYVSTQLGNQGVVLSRVGNDDDGKKILDQLQVKNLLSENIQIDRTHQTGTVNVALRNGQPSYEIVENVAWDFLELSENWRKIAENADAVCFGSLAQRSEIAQKTILKFVALTNGLRIFDVNLRQNYFSAGILRQSLQLANVVKLNHEELPVIAEMFAIKDERLVDLAEKLGQMFGLNLVCVTCGANGSFLIKTNQVSENAGLKVRVKDTIGAGDAFTAGMTHGLLRGWDLDKTNEFANRVGAFVAAQTGAMPDFTKFRSNDSQS